MVLRDGDEISVGDTTLRFTADAAPPPSPAVAPQAGSAEPPAVRPRAAPAEPDLPEPPVVREGWPPRRPDATPSETERELAHARELLADVRRQRDQLEAQNAALRQQLDTALEALRDLRILLMNPQQRAGPGPGEAPTEPEAPAPAPAPRRPWWRRGR